MKRDWHGPDGYGVPHAIITLVCIAIISPLPYALLEAVTGSKLISVLIGMPAGFFAAFSVASWIFDKVGATPDWGEPLDGPPGEQRRKPPSMDDPWDN